MHRWTWWFGLTLGGVLVVAGIAETVRLVRTEDGGLWFWFPTLVGGGALVIAGTLLLSRSPTLGCALTTVGLSPRSSQPCGPWSCPFFS